MERTEKDIAGGKSQQFTILKIERLFRFYKPQPPLSKFIENFWLYESAGTMQKIESILPTGTLELAINLRQNELGFHDASGTENCSRLSGAVISGAHSNAFAPAAEEKILIIGVHFKPGGAFPFLGLPACELADTHVDLEDLWGPSARHLRDRLCEAVTSSERFRLLEGALLGRLRQAAAPHYAVAAALKLFGLKNSRTNVRDVAKDLGLSQRRLIEVFKAEVGITPKLFNRIQRFQKTRSVIQQNSKPDWSAIAADLGYYDQSHFIREFREFSGLCPTDYIECHKMINQS